MKPAFGIRGLGLGIDSDSSPDSSSFFKDSDLLESGHQGFELGLRIGHFWYNMVNIYCCFVLKYGQDVFEY